MPTTTWTRELKKNYDGAVEAYRGGRRGAENFFDKPQLKFLASIGHTAQEVYDFAEDAVNHGEPDWDTFLLIAAVRRDYFLVMQKGKAARKPVDMEKLPPKDAAEGGIVWLPRILVKAEAKLRGKMPKELMYGCGGDRKFFADNNVHPADFLRRVWAAGGKHKKVIKWVKQSRA